MPIDMHALASYGAKARIQELQSEIDEIRKAFPEKGERRGRPAKAVAPASAPSEDARTRKPMSAAAKKAIGERMKKYWAKRKGGAARNVGLEAPAATEGTGKKKRTMSAAARAKISAAQKKRWK